MDAVPHGLDPFPAQHSKDDHERVKEVCEVPARHSGRKQLFRVVGSVELHSHHSEDEDDDSKDEAQVTKGAHRSTDYANQKVQRRPRLRQFKYSQLHRAGSKVDNLISYNMVTTVRNNQVTG